MKRRDFLVTGAALAGIQAVPAWADTPTVRSLDDAKAWTLRLEQSAKAQSTGAWPLVAMLEHMAQSVEMSMTGFPQAKPAIFQGTAGAAAFAFFRWRGRMSHSLSEPIPGAPALATSGDWRAAAGRLRNAIVRFERHQGPLKPHFAYGVLSKTDFAIAHVLHIANHQDEVALG